MLRKAAALKRICGRCAPQNADKYHNSIILNLFLMMILLIFQDRFDENGVYVLNDLFEKSIVRSRFFATRSTII